METVLVKAGHVLLEQGLPGILILGLLYVCWKLGWLWINEAQTRAAADLEDARAKEAISKAIEKQVEISAATLQAIERAEEVLAKLVKVRAPARRE